MAHEPLAHIDAAELDRIRTEAIDFAGVGLYRYKVDGAILFIDKGALRILDLADKYPDPAALVGTDISRLIEYRGPRETLRNQLRRHGHVRDFEYHFRTLTGEDRWALHDSYIVKDAKTGEEAIQAIIRDITERKRHEEALRESEQRWATTLASIGDGVIATDAEGRIVFMNPVAESLTGWPLGEAVQKPVSEVFRIVNEQTRQTVEDPVARVLKDGMVVGLANHTVLLRKDGADIPIDDSGAPIKDKDGWTTGVVLVFRGISERRQAEEALRASEARYRSLFDNMTEGFAYCRMFFENGEPADFEYLAVNAAFEKLTGLRKVAGKRVSEVIPGIRASNPELFEFYGRAAADGTQARFETFVEPLDIWFSVSVYGAEKDRFVAVFDNITERKRAVDALRQAHDELEQRVRERTTELARRAEQLRALAAELTNAEERERRRLAQVLHDHLQQLLAGAKFACATIQVAPDDAATRKGLDQVKDLLGQAIDASRSLTAELSPPILYDGGLPDALSWLARWMREKHGLEVALEVDERANPPINVRLLLFQAARELLFNVVKHAGVQRAELRLEQAAGDQLALIVADHGAGFPAPRDPEPEKAAGGFGLFNLRERLEWIGGRLEVASVPGEGAAVSVWAPVYAERPNRPRSEATARFDETEAQPALGASIRVLIADDHRIVREGLALLLNQAPDIDVVGQAENGWQAVELTRDLRPDVVLMDVTMPVLNGVEATKIIAAERPRCRVLALSMHDQVEMVQAMRDAGAAAYLVKDGPPDALIDAIRGANVAPNVRSSDET